MSDKGERESRSGDADECIINCVEKPKKAERNCLVSISTSNNFFLKNLS